MLLVGYCYGIRSERRLRSLPFQCIALDGQNYLFVTAERSARIYLAYQMSC